MSCAAALVKTCINSVGSIKKAWVAETSDITSMTKTGTVYSAITMGASAVFYNIAITNGQFLRKKAPGRQRGAYTNTITLNVNQVTQEVRDFLEAVGSCCSLTLIIEDNDGQKWVVGFIGLTSAAMGEDDGAYLLDADLDTSADKPTGQMSKIVFECIANEIPRKYTGTVPV